jgi:plastocyanin
MKKSALVAIILVVLGAIGVWLIIGRSDNETDVDTSPSTTQATNNETTQGDESDKTAAATLIYNGSGFSPRSLTIKAGETIELKNESSRRVEFSSDPHPVHTDNRELNQSSLAAGESVKFTISNKGTWGFHNHLNENEAGTITVQ